jgi:hypothetical protein
LQRGGGGRPSAGINCVCPWNEPAIVTPSTTSATAVYEELTLVNRGFKIVPIGSMARAATSDMAVYDSDHCLIGDPIQNSMELLIPVRPDFVVTMSESSHSPWNMRA